MRCAVIRDADGRELWRKHDDRADRLEPGPAIALAVEVMRQVERLFGEAYDARHHVEPGRHPVLVISDKAGAVVARCLFEEGAN